MAEGFPEAVGAAAGPVDPFAGPVELEETGHPGVDDVLARLEALEGTPTEAHVALYEDVHQRLRDTLTALDNRPGPTPGP
ncbi:hypothetical protein [Peterkaempfera sp. SMS 1(5)a]|uniref:hypothetical protein n=1 Tax=Peterkaempfera podocarpi TaxID=3232308 RepID=UPI00366E5323